MGAFHREWVKKAGNPINSPTIYNIKNDEKATSISEIISSLKLYVTTTVIFFTRRGKHIGIAFDLVLNLYHRFMVNLYVIDLT